MIKVERLVNGEWKQHGIYKDIDDAIKEAFVLGEFCAATDVRAKIISEEAKM